MIGVAVGEEDRVDAADVVGQRLRAQVGGRVDEDRADRAARTATAPADRTSIRIDGRVRRSRGSDERQTAQSQPIAGTPCDVPLPRTVTRIMADGSIGDRFYGSMMRLPALLASTKRRRSS